MKPYRMRFEGKTALVTGAGGYIGSEVAVSLAREGANLLLCDINMETLEGTAAKIDEIGGKASVLTLDVTNSADVDAAVKKAAEIYGELNIMIHVAGGSARICGPGAGKLLFEQCDEVIDKVLKVNLYGALYASRAAAKQMIAQGKGGRIINFSSTVGVNGLRFCTEYAAAKGGVIALTKSLAKELGKYHITVNSVAPGVVARPEENHNDHYKYETNFLGEMCTAEDVANLVSFVASDEARFITGQTYIIDGGRSLAMKGSEL